MTLRQPRLFCIYALLLAIWFTGFESAHAATAFEFATVQQGRAIITARDEYVQRLSPLERALKMKSEAAVSEAEFLQRLAASIQPWPESEREAVQAALDSIRPRLTELNLPLPRRVVFVRFTGGVEGNAPHTRGDAVLLTEESLTRADLLAHLIAHELFHIASRQDKAWRDVMYATIGFMPIEEVALPPALAARKVTNPDAPRVDVAIKVQTGLGSTWVTPLVHATVDRYDAHQGGEFIKYMKLSWLEVGRGEVLPTRAEVLQPQLHETAQLRGFVEQVGRNTGYIIHPEEILAENFAQLATGKTGPSPEIHQRLLEALKRQTSMRR
jgi:hypothetical protein